MNLSAFLMPFDSDTPLYRQLYDQLREAILAGTLVPGSRLPATRELAGELGISRNTVIEAFEQLIAEGYLVGKIGSGTFVSDVLPDEQVFTPATAPSPVLPPRRLSQRGEQLANTPVNWRGLTVAPRFPGAFRAGLPALDQFPATLWSQYVARQWRTLPPEQLGYGNPAGYLPLREAITEHVRSTRAVRCSPEQVLIVSGSQQALDLAARVLLDPGDTVWMEDPGYLGARGALQGAGAQLIAIPVDDEGINVAVGIERAPQARLAYVSPSHQYPLGVTLSLQRRLALLEWASRADAWILEDDYDSEFRYAGRPLAALQGLDRDGRVIYIGTFSKVMLPGLRLGYLVVPPDLVAPFTAARSLIDRHAPVVEQAALAAFIQDGQFARHIRRMRQLYAERQRLLFVAAERELQGRLRLAPNNTGLHVVGFLPDGSDDRRVAVLAGAHGLDLAPLSAYRLTPEGPPGVLVGYAAVLETQIAPAVQLLAALLQQMSH